MNEEISERTLWPEDLTNCPNCNVFLLTDYNHGWDTIAHRVLCPQVCIYPKKPFWFWYDNIGLDREGMRADVHRIRRRLIENRMDFTASGYQKALVLYAECMDFTDDMENYTRLQ